ncbi:MAG: hypothetical protein U5L07_18195 [Desulfobacterales bacterium]|nr:hypothetical protein [Desulfobacterales bacterium]
MENIGQVEARLWEAADQLRAIREGLDEEHLALFDILTSGKTLDLGHPKPDKKGGERTAGRPGV